MKSLTIQDMRQWAIDLNGKCLSKEYWGKNKKITWRCEKGHVFDLRPVFVQQGAWCRQCTIYDKKITAMELMQEWAEQRGGKCLSKYYIDSLTPLKWECKNGHIFKKNRDYIRTRIKKNWCTECRVTEHRKDMLKKMNMIAIKRQGKCLSETYFNINTKLEFECKNGHKWKTTPGVMMYHHTWCPQCTIYDKKIAAMELMHEWAKQRGGKCLSKYYVNNAAHLEWECKNGHRFKTTRNVINKKTKNWCPECNMMNPRKRMFNKIHKIAKKRGGKCLSNTYFNTDTKLEFECKNGHKWKATPHIIIYDNTWCPHCYGHIRQTIDQMHKLAAKNNGKCLSKKYINSRIPLKWQCDKGHVWRISSNCISSGSWCPKCRKK